MMAVEVDQTAARPLSLVDNVRYHRLATPPHNSYTIGPATSGTITTTTTILRCYTVITIVAQWPNNNVVSDFIRFLIPCDLCSLFVTKLSLPSTLDRSYDDRLKSRLTLVAMSLLYIDNDPW